MTSIFRKRTFLDFVDEVPLRAQEGVKLAMKTAG